jgi:DnaJ-class molecular chaperone
MLVKCNACKGQKKVMGMGYIEGDCKPCEGTGYLSVDKAIETAPRKRKKAREDNDESATPLPTEANHLHHDHSDELL